MHKEAITLKRYLISLSFIVLVVAISLTTLVGAQWRFTEDVFALLGRPTRLAAEAQSFFEDNLSVRGSLRSLSLLLRTATGQREFGGIYLCGNGLVERFVPTEDTSLQERNTQQLLAFTKREQLPVTVAVLPTASAVYQDRLPPFATAVQFNQHGFIEQLSKAFAGSAASVDVYPALYAARDEYLYYRTDDLLTARGGYLVYQSLARRLGLSPYSEQSFRIQFMEQPYYGSLYARWGYGGIKADSVALYHHDSSTLFTVSHWKRFESKTYHTLYPSAATVSGNPLDAVLGGQSPLVSITNHSLGAERGSLLVLGDRNMLSVLPLLALHYGSVTFANPDLLTDSELAGLVPSEYSQVLFAFSLERYMNSSQPARAALAGTQSSES